MKIRVTQKHIDKSAEIHRNYSHVLSEHCPIALAIKQKSHRHVCVGNKFVLIKTGKLQKYFDLPKNAQKFVETFNNWILHNMNKPKPITFELK